MKKKLIMIIVGAMIVLGALSTTLYCIFKPTPEELSDNLFINGLVAVGKNGKYGYLNKKGETVIDFVYDQAMPFYDGMAIVKTGSTYTLINTRGTAIFQDKYDYLGIDAGTGLIVFGRNGKYGLMNRREKILCDAVYDDIYYFSEGLAPVKLGSKYGFINKKGKLVIDTKYDDVSSFSEGLASVCIDDKYGYINKKGTTVIATNYDYAFDFYRGFAVVMVETDSENNFKVINKKGKLIHTDYDYIGRTKNCFLVTKGEENAIITLKGKKIPLLNYEAIFAATLDNETYLKVFAGYDEEGTFYLIDEKGKEIFVVSEDSDNDLMFDYDNFDIYLMDSSDGITLTNIKGDKVTYLVDGLDYLYHKFVVLNKNSKYGVMNLKGKKIIDFSYDGIYLTKDNYAIVEVNGKLGIIDFKGHVIVPIEYDRIIMPDLPY